jgi:uncharacterized protein YjbK
MPPIEKETKLVLSLEDYDRLRAQGRTLDCRDQLNVYLHDPSRLKEEFGYFRVRFESGRDPVATLKIPWGWRGEMREMVEVEAPLLEMGPSLYPWPRRWVSVDHDLSGELKEQLQALGIRRLRRLGWMRNHRLVVELEGLGTVELDRTRLPDGTVHYEVEVEAPQEDLHLALVEKVRSIVPAATFSRIGKFSRFLSALGSG